MTHHAALATTLLAAGLLVGCATNPSPPETVIPAAAGSFVGARDNVVSLAPVPPGWWQLFDDPVLDRHVGRALATNADLRVALATLETARAALGQARAAQFPATVLESGAGPERAADQPSTSSVPKTSYELGATIAYEIDLFGRLRAASSAARSDAEASAAALDVARVTIAADTVAAYVDLCGALANARMAAEQIAAQQRSVDLVARQLREGEVSPLELAQARALLRRADAASPPFEADRRRAQFRLATLQGLPPAEADGLKITCTSPPKIGTEIPIGNGAALIARRPDIREAERRLAAASARIGVATAELYPRISLGGSAGLIGGGFDAILTPLITWSFPNQSAARAKIAAARGTEAAALANWDGVMLRALSEVESALADYGAERTRHSALEVALAEGDKAAQRALARYRLGADHYLLVLDAERSRNETASQLAASALRIAQIQVALFRALGGGWEQTRRLNRDPRPGPPTPIRSSAASGYEPSSRSLSQPPGS